MLTAIRRREDEEAAIEQGDPRARAQKFFEDLWQRGDYWELETSAYERERHDALLAALGPRRYARVLEIGCGAGVFTRRLAPLADHVLAIDVAPAAIARARATRGEPHVEFAVADVMEYTFKRAAPFDLIVMAETIYFV